MNISFDQSKVRWEWDGKSVEYAMDGIQNAFVIHKLICLESYNGDKFQYRYLDFDGKTILYYEENGKQLQLSTPKNEEMTLIFEKVEAVMVSKHGFLVLCCCDGIKKIKEFTYSGKLQTTYDSPSGYTFYRMLSFDNQLMVVCLGDGSLADQYGRNEWTFSFDTKGEKWRKESLAY